MKNRIQDESWIITRPIAHRGLHGNDIPENSAMAYKAAIVNGYPIEMDLQLTADKHLVCFHDDNLKRMTGEDCLIWNKTLAQVRQLRLADTDEGILTFDEFLRLVNGSVPIMIEIKSQPENQLAVTKTLAALEGYNGEFAIQSFDPRVMKYVRQNAPDVIRGQLICKKRHENVSWFSDKLMAHGMLNFLSKPDFINMNCEFLPLSRAMKRGKRVLCWTVRTKEDMERAEKYADNFIFERIHI